MMDYYEVLGVGADASSQEIRTSFRKLVHRYHPDRNPKRQKWAAEKLRQAVAAYRVLADDGQRELYDMQRGDHGQATDNDAYRNRLLESKDLSRSRAALVLYDLLNGRPEEATSNFEEGVLQNKDFHLADFLPLRDWLDCTLLLAEEYERRHQYKWALNLYDEVYSCREAQKRYGEFYFEIRDRMKNLCCNLLPRLSAGAEAVTYYSRALKLDPTRPEAAYIHKKIAECHHEAGEREAAVAALRMAFHLHPNIKGTRRICQKLRFDPALRAV
jgi:curved DNA-binding protein CbpA